MRSRFADTQGTKLAIQAVELNLFSGVSTSDMSGRNNEWPVGFKGLVGIAGCVIGLGVVYFGYGIGTDSPEKKAASAPVAAAQAERKRPIRAMNMALGNMVFFARDLGFKVKSVNDREVDANKIAARIEGQLHEIRELYRQEVVKHPALAGNLTVQFNIGPTGDVSQVRELSSRFNDPDFKQAVIAAVSKWMFGELAGDPLQVNCPLLFVHEGMDITTLVEWEKSFAHATEPTVMAARPTAKAAPVSTTATAPGNVKEFKIKYATSLRTDPNFSSASLGSLTVGTKVSVLGRRGDWLEVRSINGPPGFIRKEFVTAVEVARK